MGAKRPEYTFLPATYLRTNGPILRHSVTQTTYKAIRVFQTRIKTNIRQILEVTYSDHQLNHNNPHAAPTVNTPASQMKHTST